MSAAADLGPRLPAIADSAPRLSLFGFLLRCDAENLAVSGTIARLVARHSIGPAALAKPSFQYTGTVFDLRLLAHINNLDLEDIERLTLLPTLRSIFVRPPSARTVGGEAVFRICPECADERFVGIEASLPLVTTCIRHRWLLLTRCIGCSVCGSGCPGSDLTAFSHEAKPFECHCGLPWAAGPRVNPSPQELLVQRRIVAAYWWLIDHADRSIPAAAREIADLDPQHAWSHGFEAPEHRPRDLRPVALPASLKAIVSVLVERNLPPTRLAEILPVPRRPIGRCPNRRCRADGSFMRRNGARNGEWETYCSFCGSRFLGSRIMMSFDFDHGDPRLSREAVQRARARLVGFRIATYKAAVELRLERPSEEISLEEVFVRAKVPVAAYLRAHRLMLRRIAKSALQGLPLLDDGLDLYGELDARWRPPWPVPVVRPKRVVPPVP